MLGTLLATSPWLVFIILQLATVRGWMPNIGDDESNHGVVEYMSSQLNPPSLPRSLFPRFFLPILILSSS